MTDVPGASVAMNEASVLYMGRLQTQLCQPEAAAGALLGRS